VPVTVYLDTSFLMLCAKFHADLLSEAEKLVQKKVEFLVPASVHQELTDLSRDAGTSGRDARVALQLIDQRGIRIVAAARRADADDVLADASELPRVVVATADHRLRRRIRAAQRPVIFLREKAKLELEGIEAAYW